VNQHDSHYMSLRRQANEEGDKMARCFDESQAAYKRGDGGQAKQLSNEGKMHKANMERLNKEASDWIYVKNNEDSRPGEVDLHGLYVKEAIARTENAIAEARQRGDGEVHLIVGQGLHSPGGAAKIKPAIAELIQRENLAAELDPHNAGVLVVRLDGKGGMGSDEIARRLDRKDEGCFIM
jgi:DNA-nicking Smr family endonuclease